MDRLSQESSNLAATWNVASSASGSVTPAGRLQRRFTSVEHLICGQAEDVFRLTIAATNVPLKLDGRDAVNRIELSVDTDVELSSYLQGLQPVLMRQENSPHFSPWSARRTPFATPFP